VPEMNFGGSSGAGAVQDNDMSGNGDYRSLMKIGCGDSSNTCCGNLAGFAHVATDISVGKKKIT
jgi:hypothetical protein